MEGVLLRFPHIGQQILQLLRFKDLLKCQKVSRSLKTFLSNETLLQFKLIKNKTNAPTQMIWKILRKVDVKIVSDLAGIVNIAYERLPKETGKLSSIIISEILHQAACKGNVSIYELLTENVLDANPTQSNGSTPLHLAALKGHIKVCELLLENIEDKMPFTNFCIDETPARIAIENNHIKYPLPIFVNAYTTD